MSTASHDRDLGLDCPITRRDFLNAALLGSGAVLVSGRAATAEVAGNSAWDGYGGTGDYARSHGNMWSTLTAAHRLRDGEFSGEKATRAAVDSGEHYDLIVAGGGVSGLAAAYTFRQMRRGKCLVLDNHPMIGGESKRNEFNVDGQRLIGPQGANIFAAVPPSGWITEYYQELGLPVGYDAYEYASWAQGVRPLPIGRDNFNFQMWSDQFASHGFYFRHSDGSLRMVKDAFGAGLNDTPWSDRLRRDFVKWRSNPKIYTGNDVARWLDGMTYEDLLVREMKLSPEVARYADPILAAGAGGLGSDVISAQLAAQLGMPGAANGEAYGNQSHELLDRVNHQSSFPGGNDGLMRHVVKKLVPEAIAGEGFADILNGKIRFDRLDRRGSDTRIRLSTTVIRVANLPDGRVEVIYLAGNNLHRVTAGGVVMANGAWNSQYIVADTTSDYREAFKDFVRAPIMVVNVALRRWRFMYELGITAASYRDDIGFSCNIRQSMLVGDYRPTLDPDAPVVLTFYIPFPQPGSPLKAQAAAARGMILSTPYIEFERRIRGQMVRLFGRAGFDPRADIAGVILNRWGHAYVCPPPGFYFGRGGGRAAPDVLRQPIGRITFANAELNGHQQFYAASLEGKRAVEQLYAHA
jgi:spermidine dehydrogenase